VSYQTPPRRPGQGVGPGSAGGDPTRGVSGAPARPAAPSTTRADARRVDRTRPARSLAAQPMRDPDPDDTRAMTRRAWWLIGLNVLIPGSAQSLAGNRRLGRVGLTATLIGWLLVIVALVILLANRAAAVTFFTHPAVLTIVQIIAVAYLALWIVLTLDTIRLARLPRIPPAARLGVPAAALVLLTAFTASGAYAVSALGVTRETVDEIFTAAGPVEPPVDGRYNFLVIGADAGEDRDGLRTDSVAVVSVDAETGQSVMIGIPRNLYDAPFPAESPMHDVYPEGYGVGGCLVDVCQFNSIYTEVELFRPELYPDAASQGSSPGIEAVVDAAEGITGLHIHHYVLVDMNGFAEMVDALGGVTINVEQEVPIFTDGTFTEVLEYIGPGVVEMNGYYALWYARSRHATSDYDRMERQRQVQEALIRQFTPERLLGSFQEIAAAGQQLVSTDIPQAMLGTFMELASKARDLEITKLNLVPDNGVDPEFPDFAYIRELVASVAPPAVAPSGTPTPAP